MGELARVKNLIAPSLDFILGRMGIEYLMVRYDTRNMPYFYDLDEHCLVSWSFVVRLIYEAITCEPSMAGIFQEYRLSPRHAERIIVAFAMEGFEIAEEEND